jgi:hypothetical protein
MKNIPTLIQLLIEKTQDNKLTWRRNWASHNTYTTENNVGLDYYPINIIKGFDRYTFPFLGGHHYIIISIGTSQNCIKIQDSTPDLFELWKVIELKVGQLPERVTLNAQQEQTEKVQSSVIESLIDYLTIL